MHTMKEKEEKGAKGWFWTFKWKYVRLFRDSGSGVSADTSQEVLMPLHGKIVAEPSQAPFYGELPLLALTFFFFFFHKVNGKWNTGVPEEMS